MRGKILKNIPGLLGERGEVYELTVIVELQDGTRFYLDDNKGNSRDETVGTIKTLGILADLANVEKLSSPKKGVETTYRLPEDPAEQEHIYARDEAGFTGEIVDIDEKRHLLYTDIGMGTIGVALCWQERDSFPDYRIGDYIRVGMSRNGLVGVWDLDDTGGSGWVHIVANHVNTPSGNQFYSAFGLDYVYREEVKDLVMVGARDGVEVGKHRYRYVEPTSGRTLRILIADNGYLVTAHPETHGVPTGMLKENLRTPVRIVSVRPDAEYQGLVYTQVVRVEFSDGTRASVFDNDLLCTPAMVGRDGTVVLRMLADMLEKSTIAEQRIYAEPSMPLLEVNGRIDAIIIPDDPGDAERGYDAVVDFGVGTVIIEVDKRYFRLQLKEGDYVRVDGRVDLKGIE
ncbi:hypothetical protein [Methanoculleus sp.]|uniref:hypothetical protein n=1 Tax=Methanoculleus sp. TaxID=90427 RepID=UPI002637320F|nr:hypothetical protein [Methanoculleus sp.]